MADVARASARLLVEVAPKDLAMFRFLLEANENLALFTVLDRKKALLKIVFSPDSRKAVLRRLDEIGRTVPLIWQDWPWDPAR